MLKFEKDAMYSLTDLEQICSEHGLRVRRFLDQVKPTKITRDLFWGQALIDAINEFVKQRERQRDPVTGRWRRRHYAEEVN